MVKYRLKMQTTPGEGKYRLLALQKRATIGFMGGAGLFPVWEIELYKRF